MGEWIITRRSEEGQVEAPPKKDTDNFPSLLPSLPPSYLASTVSRTKVLISCSLSTARVGAPTATAVGDAELGVALRAFSAA